jgi:hypothetical protein
LGENRRKLMSDAPTVIEKLSSYRKGIDDGDLADVRFAVKVRLWLQGFEATPRELARTNEFLDELQQCLERRPTADEQGALDAIERARVYWHDPARYRD